MERETGFEPATACLEGRYSTSLSYSRWNTTHFNLKITRRQKDNRWVFGPVNAACVQMVRHFALLLLRLPVWYILEDLLDICAVENSRQYVEPSPEMTVIG